MRNAVIFIAECRCVFSTMLLLVGFASQAIAQQTIVDKQFANSANTPGEPLDAGQLFDRTRIFSFFFGASLVRLRGNAEYEDARIPKIGFMLGASGLYHFTKNFELDVKVFYDKKGGAQKVNVQYFDNALQTMSTGKVKYDYKLDYVTMPIMLRFSPQSTRFFFGTGAFLGYAINQRRTTQNYFNNGDTNTIDLASVYHKFDCGISANLGYHFRVADIVRVEIQGLCNIGLYDIMIGEPYGGGSLKTSSISIATSVSYMRKK